MPYTLCHIFTMTFSQVDMVNATCCVNKKQLLRFIRKKAVACGSEEVQSKHPIAYLV